MTDEEEQKVAVDLSHSDTDPDRFMKRAKLFVLSAYNSTVDNEDLQISAEELFVVWFSKTLQNWKALVATTVPGDGLYFEVTHNGDKDETYVDVYMKISNHKFSPQGV